ncbi:MAG: hypothetical protein AMJ93_10520 [Anaerolineae bacterium SM23_84]|nr:MAG: hypothetical protein AMJ93_10520 [Anaerolineae bacterium SM23_84]
MQSSQRLKWLRRALLVKAALCFLAWGLPALLAPPAVLRLFGLSVPEDPMFLRSSGSAGTAGGAAALWPERS